MAQHKKTVRVPFPTMVISVIAVFVAGLLIGGFTLRFGRPGSRKCDCSEARPGATAANADKRYRIYPRPHSATIGPKNAKVTLVEAVDYQCPQSRRVADTIGRLIKAFPQDLRLVLMHNPHPSHPDARTAAVAAQAAHKQGKFWSYHELLFKHPRKLKRANLVAYAKQLGLDVAKFNKDMNNRRLQIQVTQDMQQLRRLGALGTPTFFMNGRYIRGAKPLQHFQKLVRAEIRHADKILKSGVAKGLLYRTIMKTAEFRIGGKGRDRKGGRPGRRRPPREDPNAVYKADIEGRPWKGAQNATVTLVEWSDFQCPRCKRVNQMFVELLKKYPKDLKIVWHDFPPKFHKQAMPAAIAAREVYNQMGSKAFWAMHDKIFANARNITDKNLAKWAKKVGANAKKVDAAIKNKAHEKDIRASMRAGQAIGVRGTPMLLINGRKYRGQRDTATLGKLIEAELKKANGIIGRGDATRATYYAHVMKKGLTKVKYLPGSGGKEPNRRRPQRRRLDPNAIYKVTLDGKSPYLGPRQALVTIVIWMDFQCPYCKWAACVVKQIVKAYPKDVRIVFKHNPLGFRKQAMPAAEVAMAAFDQKGNRGFWALHDKIFRTDKCKPKMPPIREWLRSLPRPAPKLDMTFFTKHAKGLGLNVAKLKAGLEKHTFQARIKAEQSQATKLGARGTPAFFINGKYIRGMRPFEQMKQLIDAEIVRVKKLMAAKKISTANVYDAIIANGASAPVYVDAKGGAKPAVKARPGRPGGRPKIRFERKSR